MGETDNTGSVIEVQTMTANDIEVSEAKRKYDEQCKKVLSNKYILANILKYTVEEVKGKTIEEIVNAIDGEPEVGTKGVLECTDKITGENTEDSSVSKGTLYYDIRFSLRLGQQKYIKILFDIEAQKDYTPGYHIVTRGIVYGARMISSQIGTEFDLKHYDDAKKVYSIWICFDVAKKIGNAISRYAIQKEDILGRIPDKKQAYDKLTVIEVCLNEENESQHELMCNLSGRIEEKNLEKGMEKGIKKGMEKGLAQGLEQGKAIEFINSIEKLKETLSIPLEEALRVLGKTMQDYTNAQKLLK